MRRARVIAPFPKDQAEDLELIEGDFIDILADIDEQWYKGRNKSGEEGIFPSNFVERLEDQYQAVFDYHSDTEGDLVFSIGEIITVTSKGRVLHISCSLSPMMLYLSCNMLCV